MGTHMTMVEYRTILFLYPRWIGQGIPWRNGHPFLVLNHLKWHLKGQVNVTTMEKGFLSFDFTCSEDLANILCEGPWSIGRATLVLQKWSSKLDLNESFF